MKVARDRRGALTALRDQASVIEVQEVRALSRDAWQHASAQVAQVDAEARAAAIKEQRARTRARVISSANRIGNSPLAVRVLVLACIGTLI